MKREVLHSWYVAMLSAAKAAGIVLRFGGMAEEFASITSGARLLIKFFSLAPPQPRRPHAQRGGLRTPLRAAAPPHRRLPTPRAPWRRLTPRAHRREHVSSSAATGDPLPLC